MLKQLRIGQKLMLSFLLIAIISGVAGVVSIIVLNQYRTKYDDTLERFGFGLADASMAMLYSDEAQGALNQIVSYTDQVAIQKAKTTFGEVEKNIRKVWKRFRNAPNPLPIRI